STLFFFFSSRRRHTRFSRDWSSDVCSSDLAAQIFNKMPAKKRYQATPPAPQRFGTEAFQKSGETVIRWMGNGGFFINSRGSTLMVDPLLKGFDIPVLFNAPIDPKEVPHLDAVMITHSD